MVMSPAGLGTKNYCAVEGQQQFTRPADRSSSDVKMKAVRPSEMLGNGDYMTSQSSTLKMMAAHSSVLETIEESQKPGRHSNRVPSEYRSRTLPLQ
jgi:hypothetical protein